MTQVSWYRQLALALTLFILGTLAYWLEYKHKPEKEAAEQQSKRVFQLKESQIQSVTLTDGAKVLALSCTDFSAKLCKPGDNSKWEISQPKKLRADDPNANSFISTLNNLDSNEVIDLKDETPEKRAALIKEYGLDPQSRKAAPRVDVVTQSGETILYLGLPHPINDNIFALKESTASGQKPTGNADENHVYLIPSYFKSNFSRDLTYWRDKKLLTFGAHEIESFHLKGSKDQIAAEKKNNEWLIQTKQGDVKGDIENIDNYLTNVTYLAAKSFVTDDKQDTQAKMALKGFAPALTLTLQKEKGTAKEKPAPITLTLYQKKPVQPTGKLYATLSNLDPLFELEANAKDRLDKALKDLRLSKLITSMDRFGAKRLEFSGTPIGTIPVILTSVENKWVNSADKKEVSTDKIQDVLDKLYGNKIKDFYTGSSIPTGEKEGLKVTLGDEKNEKKRELLFWKKDKSLYARDLLSRQNEAFLVDTSVADALPWNKGFFAPKPPAPATTSTKKSNAK